MTRLIRVVEGYHCISKPTDTEENDFTILSCTQTIFKAWAIKSSRI